jgi:16S rRNA (cytosine967-C5)-methyltransferase
VAVATAATDALPALGPWPLVLVDAPCSGSGTWRRDPEGKWALTPDRLAALQQTQDGILDAAAALTASGGRLAYVTCSLLAAENRDRVRGFLDRTRGWTATQARQFMPGASGDGFCVEILARKPQG